MTAAPIFHDRIAVDVLYEKAAVFSGGALRCTIEMRGPPINPSTEKDSSSSSYIGGILVRFVTFQFIGTVTAARNNTMSALDFSIHEIEGKIQAAKSDVDKFTSMLIEDASRIFPPEDRNKEGTTNNGDLEPNNRHSKNEMQSDNVNATIKNMDSITRTSVSGNDINKPNQSFPDVCYDPPIDPSTIVFVKSFPIVVCENEIFNTEQIQIFGLEFLLPPFLPPSFAGTVYKYTYYISAAASTTPLVSPSSLPRVDQIRLPVHVIGPASTGMLATLHQASPLILDRKLKTVSRLPNDTNLVLFDFCGRSWKGGSQLCQSFYRPGVASQLGPPLLMSQSDAQADPYPSLESETLSWLLSLQPDHHSSLFYTANPNSTFSQQLTSQPLIKQSHVGGYGPLDDFWCEDDESEMISSITEGMPQIQERLRISHDSYHVVTVQILGLNPKLSFPSKFTKVPTPTHYIGCPLSGSLVVGFDFTEAQIETLEIHASIVRLEASAQASIPHSTFPFFALGPFANSLSLGDPLVNRHTIVEIKESVLHVSQHAIEMKVPSHLSPSFETELLSVSYSLVITLFCVGTTSSGLSPNETPFSITSLDSQSPSSAISLAAKLDRPIRAYKNRNMIELQWTIGLIILPPVSIDSLTSDHHSVDLPPSSDFPLGHYNPTSICWSIGEGNRKLHRGLLL